VLLLEVQGSDAQCSDQRHRLALLTIEKIRAAGGAKGGVGQEASWGEEEGEGNKNIRI